MNTQNPLTMKVGPMDIPAIVDLLSLVGVHITKEQAATFTQEQLVEVSQWASLEYLAASDNHVKRRPRPACLAQPSTRCDKCKATMLSMEVVWCRHCQRAYRRCDGCGGVEGARRSLHSHVALHHTGQGV
jgi:hypothetical protein